MAQPEELNPLNGGTNSRGYGLNENGTRVVGYSEASIDGTVQDVAALWDLSGSSPTVQQLGDIPQGFVASRSYAVNNSGLAVGQFCGTALLNDGTKRCPTDSQTQAFAWENGSINDFSETLALPENAGWSKLNVAWGLNEAGDIVGNGTFNGESRAFLATAIPVPFEPSSSLGLSILGGFSAASWLKRQLKRQKKTTAIL